MSNKGDGDDYVTRAEFTRERGAIFEELARHGLALYGEDGRGGIQHDISEMKTSLTSIEKNLINKKDGLAISKELGTRRFYAYIAAIAGISGPIMLLIVEFLLNLLFG